MKQKLGEKLKSVQSRLFLSLCVVVFLIIMFLIIVNSFILESFYLYSKVNTLESVYDQINSYTSEIYNIAEFEEKLERISINNNFDILIKTNQNVTIYTTTKDYIGVLKEFGKIAPFNNKDYYIEENENYTIKSVQDTGTSINYILLSGKLDKGYLLYIRMPIPSIRESVKISNRFLYTIAIFVIVIGGVVVSYISKRFTKPIQELNDIAKKMSNLDFSHKYKETNQADEIDELGKSINSMSTKLETTITQLKATNRELERDIEQKSKLEQMRSTFISDVSHELKTPIALIQGYSEGLLENVNTDEESRKFYAEVILDESNKMDKLVKQLLELMKLENEMRTFDNKSFNVVELEKEILRKTDVMIKEKEAEIRFNDSESINVIADNFYIEQVITNYLTNAIKHVREVKGEKYISIENEVKEDVVRVKIFNTGKQIDEENLDRIWKRFYKGDESRNREDGGTGIGLALVRAIMNNYGNDFGVINKENGVEFYFELQK
jgi:signal transduction histidine kinase